MIGAGAAYATPLSAKETPAAPTAGNAIFRFRLDLRFACAMVESPITSGLVRLRRPAARSWHPNAEGRTSPWYRIQADLGCQPTAQPFAAYDPSAILISKSLQ